MCMQVNATSELAFVNVFDDGGPSLQQPPPLPLITAMVIAVAAAASAYLSLQSSFITRNRFVDLVFCLPFLPIHLCINIRPLVCARSPRSLVPFVYGILCAIHVVIIICYAMHCAHQFISQTHTHNTGHFAVVRCAASHALRQY